MSAHTDKNDHPYQALTPDCVLDAVEAAGLRPDGRLLALNSYENRVYQVGVEDGAPVIAKFYRPGRWSDEAIAEEHRFAAELAERDVPVVAPLPLYAGAENSAERGSIATLRCHAGFRFALYPRRGGHWPELEDEEVLLRLGRFVGRLHAVGSAHRFSRRPTLDIASFGEIPVHYLLESGAIPREYRENYADLTTQLLNDVRAAYGAAGRVAYLRLHGDFHPGNILWTDLGAHLVDLDDARTGPALQDLWMLLSGDRAQMARQLGALLDGYEEFMEFDRRELHLLEALRSLRLIHYAAWLAERWSDPSFPRAFPWFNTARYWEEHLVTLREQRARMEEPPLSA